MSKIKPSDNQSAPVQGKKAAKYTDNSVIKVLVEGNPKRPNTKAFQAFKCYKDGMTVGEFLAHEATSRRDLSWDVDHEFIAIQ